MKTEQEIAQSWKNLATAPEFDDCLSDLMRYCKFWKPLGGDAPMEKHLEASVQRGIVTYILKKTEYPSLEIDMKRPER